MAGLTKTQVTYVCTTTAPRYIGVVQDTTGENKCKVPSAANGIPLGAISNDEQLVAGRPVAVQIDGYVQILAGEEVAIGDEVIIGAGGKVVKASTIVSGTANILGVAETAGALDQVVTIRVEKKAKEIIPVIPAIPVFVTGLALKTAPAKVAFTTAETLDLTGMVVTLTKSDESIEDVAFTQFGIKGITTLPVQGAALTADITDVIIAYAPTFKTVGQVITVTQAQ